MRSVFLAVVLVLSLAGPVAAGDQVPFKGSLAGTVTVTPLDPPFAFVVVEGAGRATHLGAFHLRVPARPERGDPHRDRNVRVHGRKW
jgi:hypothetical protein